MIFAMQIARIHKSIYHYSKLIERQRQGKSAPLNSVGLTPHLRCCGLHLSKFAPYDYIQ